MGSSKKTTVILIALVILLGITFVVFKVLDQKKRVIERKTGYDVPNYCTIEKYVAGGSMFHRNSFEAKIRIDTSDHMFEVINEFHEILGENHDEIELSRFNIIKYELFGSCKLIPNPTSSSWEAVGKVKDGDLVVFVCLENNTDPYLYMYYAE